ncbi:MAG: cytochrome c biogenesis protein ResB [Aquabacterium sp.]|jgi:cytochrome c biogenesis protein|uniref:cytochrome c biogenesis protein ResB n=1 Tax=Aquabacterium sp. TaxID=1872578 RepID=UPI003BB08BD2
MTAAVDSLPPLPARSARADALELLASMRFAIALLTVICIASAIGTVLQQGQPLVNYVDAFGPYWAEVFGALGLFNIYSSGWFLVILAFLVISTSLCIARNVPKILTDLRTFKENVRVRALDAFHHKAHGSAEGAPAEVRDRVLATLAALGWQVKAQERLGAASATGAASGVPAGAAGAVGEAGTMIAARRGRANKLGYIAAHSAIVLVCLGGLFDGEMVTKTQAWWQDLVPFKGNNPGPKNSLGVDNPAYRAQLFVPEGARSGSAVLNLPQGMLLQPLPFEVELRKFIVEYYDTGMPKRFASEIVVHDARDKSTHAATVEVNKPFVYDGVTIFQSSFEDGGSTVELKPHALYGQRVQEGDVFKGMVGGDAITVPRALSPREALSVEITGLRPVNVEDLAQADGATQAEDTPKAGGGSTDARGVNFQELGRQLGSDHKSAADRRLTNIGPSVTYKLRDAAGQAREYQNYMLPVHIGGQPLFLLGVRSAPSEPFRFLRVPADDQMQLTGWLRLREALADAGMRQQAVQRFSTRGADGQPGELVAQLALSSQRVLELYAGVHNVVDPAQLDGAPQAAPTAGFQALTDFIEKAVPEAERERASATLIRILNGTLFELLNVVREHDGLKPLSPDEPATGAFMTQAVLSLSDANAYPAPFILLPSAFEQRQASVFQVTRTPGRNVVYLGCILLIVGVFAMLYVRERRVWVWVRADEAQPGRTAITLALSSTRQTLDTDHEFDRLRHTLLPSPATQDEVI